jgi:hypothetical protein
VQLELLRVIGRSIFFDEKQIPSTPLMLTKHIWKIVASE